MVFNIYLVSQTYLPCMQTEKENKKFSKVIMTAHKTKCWATMCAAYNGHIAYT